jgi:hypothetical protein
LLATLELLLLGEEDDWLYVVLLFWLLNVELLLATLEGDEELLEPESDPDALPLAEPLIAPDVVWLLACVPEVLP